MAGATASAEPLGYDTLGEIDGLTPDIEIRSDRYTDILGNIAVRRSCFMKD